MIENAFQWNVIFRNENNTFFPFYYFLFLVTIQSKRDVEKLVDEINEGRPQCPVGLNTLVIPRKIALNEHMNQPYVYLNCGHVQGKQKGAFIIIYRIGD